MSPPASFASKIGGLSGIGRDSGGDAVGLEHIFTQNCSEDNNLNCYWRDAYGESRQFHTLKGGGFLTCILTRE